MSHTSTCRWRAALVTGASSGIGRALVWELASRGAPSLILVARRQEVLTALGEELTERFGTDVEVLAADLVDDLDRGSVEARLASDHEPVDLLVNNAGIGRRGAFFRLDPDGEQDQVALNVTAVLRLARAALPGMVSRHFGTIVNVSSMAASQPSPGMATYAATKAFVTLFSESLFEELRGTGVTTTAVLAGYTRTNFQRSEAGDGYDDAPEFAWMSPRSVAEEALDAAAEGRALCIPGSLYRTVNALESPLPRSARRWLMGRLSRFSIEH